MSRPLGFLVAIALLVVRPVEGSSILINGSFEVGPSFSNQDIDIAAGSTSITGWLVTGSGLSAIDYLGPPWFVADGLYAIDLDGRDSLGSGIQQSFATAPGQSYLVSFALSGNPGNGTAGTGLPLIKQLRVAVGNFTQDYEFDSSGQSITNLIWQPIAFQFLATDTATTLTFASVTPFPNSYGALIDDVSVTRVDVPTPVPEPGSGALLLSTGLLALLIARHKTHLRLHLRPARFLGRRD